MSNIINIFSPFYWKKNMQKDHDYIASKYVDAMIANYENNPSISPDWNVHTSYNSEHLLLNPIEWNLALPIYKKYIDEFILEYFEKEVKWEWSGTPWYTIYGANQTANIHEHIPDTFSVVHYIKFNPEQHWPISFINPMGATTKYLLALNPNLKENINFNSQYQSLYHPRFTPQTEQGDLLIFPSHLEHMVEKVSSKELRISIAANINII